MTVRTPSSGGDGRPAAAVLREILSSAARRLRARVTTWSGRDAPVRVGIPEERTVGALLEEAEDASLWARFSDRSGGPPVFIVIEGGLLSALIGRLFGAGEGEAPRVIGSEPTEVERAVGARVCRELVEALRSCWMAGEPPDLVPAEVAPSARVAEDQPVAERYLSTELVVGGSEDTLGALRVLLPMAALRAAAPERPAPAPPPPPAPKALRYDRVLPIEVEVVVGLAQVSLPIKRLRSLRVGDEIALPPIGDVTARVGGTAALLGEAGIRDGARSLRVTRRISSSNGTADDR